MIILGISAFYHDSAAALVSDGDIVAAAQEERFTRVKHDSRFPMKAIGYCLKEAGAEISDVDYVVFYDKPLMTFDRLIETYVAYAPMGFLSFMKAIPIWLKQKLFTRREIRKQLGRTYRGKILFTEHHESHAASAYYPSPFKDAAVLTVDGVGEWATASISHGIKERLEILKEMRFPHSLGLLYSAFTSYCGFKVNSGEYKLMGLAPYGNPVYVEKIKEHLIDIKEDGSLWLDMRYFNYCNGLTMTSTRFHDLFEGGPRKPESNIGQREMDLAASIQVVAEEVMMKMAVYAKKITGSENLCLAGGVALNCVCNGKILRSGEFEGIWIQPAAGDAGGALGAALFVWYQLLINDRNAIFTDSQKGSLLGIRFGNDEIEKYLSDEKIPHRFYSDNEIIDQVSSYLVDQKIVGWFQGRMEFGPRALGARSIIGDARNRHMQSVMNMKIKYRESFRPFAPCVLEEDCTEYFELNEASPYMLIVAPIRPDKRLAQGASEMREMNSDPDIFKRVNIPRSVLPAVTHVDYSARVQTVDRERHGKYYDLIKKFKEKSGSGVIINTSFNIRGEPIVCTPGDALQCFMKTEMDILVLENYLVVKEDQKQIAKDEINQYRESFDLD